MAKSNSSKQYKKQDRIHLKMLQRLRILKEKLKTSLQTGLNQVTKSVYPILIAFLVRIPVSLSLLLVFLALVSLTL